MSLHKEPLVHFALMGGLIFGVWSLARKGRVDPAGVPAAVTATATTPGARTVTITARDLEAQRAEFRAAWKREPDASELGELISTLVDEEVLYREALAEGLGRDDKLVRRRLIEKMTALARPTAPSTQPSRQELERWYQTYSHRFRRPTTVTFDALFFDPKRRADAGADATRALAALAAARPSDPPPRGQGDTFILSSATSEQTELELAHLLGETFSRAVMAAPLGRWQGPVTSRYGAHLVRVTRRTPERLPAFDEIEARVRADWLTVEVRGQRGAAATLLPRYEIVLPDELRQQVAAAPALAPSQARVPR
jgi:peptidyl-prolyl cis-trans isomerase C